MCRQFVYHHFESTLRSAVFFLLFLKCGNAVDARRRYSYPNLLINDSQKAKTSTKQSVQKHNISAFEVSSYKNDTSTLNVIEQRVERRREKETAKENQANKNHMRKRKNIKTH